MLLRQHLREHALAYGTGLFLTASASLLAVLTPWLIGHLAEGLVRGSTDQGCPTRTALQLVGVGLARAGTWYLGGWILLRQARQWTYLLRKRLLETWSALPPAFFHSRSTGALLAHAMNDVEVVRELLSMELCMTISGLFMLGTILGLMLVKGDWRLTLAGLGPLLLLPFAVRSFAPSIKGQSRQCQEALGALSSLAGESIRCIRTLKAFGQEAAALDRFTQKALAIQRCRLALLRVTATFEALVPLLANLGFIATLVYGGYLAAQGHISISMFTACTFYVTMLRNPLVHLGKVISLIQRASASLGRISAMLQEAPHSHDPEPARNAPPPAQGRLQVEHLSFRYPGACHNAVTDLSFSLEPGKILGIVGATGSGKSTLASLLLRFFEPPPGSIFLDGQDIRVYSLPQLRHRIAWTPQERILLSGSILDNIAFSEGPPDVFRAQQAAKEAGLHETIQALPGGYGSEIGEMGVGLSGGQQQRLTLARMLYRQASIRIIDDALSAVDATTEATILHQMKAAHAASPNTTIITSHRLSAVQDADEILVLEAGRLVERGTHTRLLAQGGAYAQLWQAQTIPQGMDNQGPHSQQPASTKPKSKADHPSQEPEEPSSLLHPSPSIIRSHFWPYVNGQKGRLGLAFLAVILVVLIETVQPYLGKAIFDQFPSPTHAKITLLLKMAGAYLATVLAASGLTYGQEIGLQQAGIAIITSIRQALFGHAQQLSLGYLERSGLGRIITNLVHDTETLASFFHHMLPALLRGTTTFVLIAIFMLRLNTAMTLPFFLLVPIAAVLSALFRKRLAAICGDVRERLAELMALLSEQLQAMAVIQAFHQEALQQKRFALRNNALKEASIRENQLSLLFACFTDLLGDASVAMLIWLGGGRVCSGALHMGVLYGLIAYLRRFFQPISTITQQVNLLQGARVAAARITDTFAHLPDIQDPPGASAPKAAPCIQLDQVSFSYQSERPVLQNISIQIPSGSRIGILGASGSGKTSLINLIARLHDPTGGRVKIGGKDLRQWPLAALRQIIALVPQEPSLIQGSITDNLRFFRKGISQSRIQTICQTVGVETCILKLPQGYETTIQEAGTRLSSGERQLLCLARALLTDPSILILDEATASIDPAMDQRLQKALKGISKQCTLIVVAHRLGTVRNLDRLLVLHDGKMEESGTHEELLDRRGHYYSLCRSQASGTEASFAFISESQGSIL